MLLTIIILVAAGLYVCIKREVQASSSFVIRGQPALNIGIALVAGGLLAVGLPFLCALIGIFDDFVAGLVVSLATIAASLGYVVFVILAEKKRQAGEAKSEAKKA